MEQYLYPLPNDWARLCHRPVFEQDTLAETVKEILKEVKEGGDEALLSLTQRFDSAGLSNLQVSTDEVNMADIMVPEELKAAIKLAKANIETFHKSQRLHTEKVETMNGVTCWRKEVAIETVGLYIPGGTAPLFSTILMLAVPATIAGCKRLVMCTPPDKDGKINPAVLYTAKLCGIELIIKAGGAQAIAAMAYGTQSVPKVDKIFGPGNQYVTAAKQIVSSQNTAIDLPAGPSEVLIIADGTAEPEFIAADLLSQAEHGLDSQVVLITDDESFCKAALDATRRQMENLPRKAFAEKAIENSKAIVLNSISECVEFSNIYAPEHLIIATEDALNLSKQIINAGSVFVGHYTPESAGDYASGTNHTLPTNGFARSYSGVNLQSFTKAITFQQITPAGLKELGPSVEIMAATEQLDAHKLAVSVRLNKIKENGI